MRSAGWYPRALRGHAALLTGLALLLSAVGAAAPEPPVPLQLALLIPLVLVLGVPHGAVDAAEAERALSPRLGRHWRPVFVVLYLALAGLVVGAFAVAPVASLVLFLGVSLLHFGASDRFPAVEAGAAAALEIAARGSLAVLLPAALHAEEVGRFFGWLAPDAAGVRQVVEVCGWLGGPLLLLILASIAQHALRARHWRDDHALAAAELSALMLACAMLPPLLFFGLSFCVGHALRQALTIGHSLAPAAAHQAGRRFVRAAAPATVATWLLFACAFPFLANQGLSAAAFRVLFVGLAALTLPHVVFHLAASRSARLRPALA